MHTMKIQVEPQKVCSISSANWFKSINPTAILRMVFKVYEKKKNN